jgi:hypothetical protein
MRLHDVQVAINASNAADKMQHNAQNQPQTAQLQAGIKAAEEANTKLTQTAQAMEEDGSKPLGETDLKQKKWKKQNSSKGRSAKNANPGEENNPKNQMPGSGQIIDIKA